jgi:hypothetical protein
MKRAAPVVVLVAGICAVVLWVSQCSGPRAVVDSAPVLRAPEQPGQAYGVDAIIRNTGSGHGEVQVTFTLRDRVTNQTYQRIDRAEIEAGDRIHIAVEIPAPPGDYEPQVQVDYPPGV